MSLAGTKFYAKFLVEMQHKRYYLGHRAGTINNLNKGAQPDVGGLVAVDLPVDGQQLRVQTLHVADVGAPREKSESGLYI